MSKRTLLNEYLASKKEYEENKTMNLSKLFKMQKKLDQHIIQEKGLEGQDLLDKKILALQVELGELANEWRGFKFWSKDQEPRTEVFATSPNPNEPLVVEKNPLLEEYIDCLHFILSIGLEIGDENWKPHYSKVAVHFCGDELTTQFNELFRSISGLRTTSKAGRSIWYGAVFSTFLGLGEMLGFTWEQIEQAYFEKNKVNHERQENGY